MNTSRLLKLTLSVTIAAGLGGAFALRGADAKPKYSVKDVMKAVHKGDENLGKKISRGQGTADDYTKLLDYYQALPSNKPPRGEQSSWDAKTTALVKAAQALKSGGTGAVEAYKAATNCKACHSAHKPEQK